MLRWPAGYHYWAVPYIDSILPYLRVATAASPFAVAVVLRLLAGRNRVTYFLLSVATTWFAINVLLAPFTDPGHIARWLMH